MGAKKRTNARAMAPLCGAEDPREPGDPRADVCAQVERRARWRGIEEAVGGRREPVEVLEQRRAVARGLRAREVGAGVAVEGGDARDLLRRERRDPLLRGAREEPLELGPLALPALDERVLVDRAESRPHAALPVAGNREDGGASTRPAFAARS